MIHTEEIKSGVVRVPAHTLIIAKENPRTEADEETIKQLANSIEANGLLTPLIVYEEDDKHHVTAGSRRYRAMAMLGWTNELVDVAVYEKGEAIHYGIVEQLGHEKLSARDEVMLFGRPEYRNATLKELSRIIGKSVPYVKQHLKVLCLPDDVLTQFTSGAIDYEQALGLTYFIGHDDMMASTLEHVLTYPTRWDLDQIVRVYNRSFVQWENHPWTQYVSKEDYLKAGGYLAEDLFDETCAIESPEILKDLARKQILGIIEGETPEGQPIMELQELVDHNQEHPGIEGEYPDDLRRILVTEWKLMPQRHSGYSVRHNVITNENRSELIELGYIEHVDAAEEPTAKEESESLSAALVQRIAGIRLHAVRQEMASNPQAIFTAYSSFLEEGFRAGFSFEREPCNLPEVNLIFSKGYGKLAQAQDDPKGTAAGVRDRLAYNLLTRLSRAQDTHDLEPACIRKSFLPDADFLKAYKKPQLLEMMADIDEAKLGEWNDAKKGAICTKLAEMVAEKADWLPSGF